MLSAAMRLGTSALLRTGEFAVANPRQPDPHRLIQSDFTVGTSYHLLRLRASKTDPFREGVSIPLLASELDTAMIRYDKFLTRKDDAPLFTWSSGLPLGRDEIVAAASQLVSAAGVPWKNAEGVHCRGVSFRKGGASSLASVGTPDRVIQIVGRWKSGVFRQYIHESMDDLAAYFKRLHVVST